jgi:hypothetical protein
MEIEKDRELLERTDGEILNRRRRGRRDAPVGLLNTQLLDGEIFRIGGVRQSKLPPSPNRLFIEDLYSERELTPATPVILEQDSGLLQLDDVRSSAL